MVSVMRVDVVPKTHFIVVATAATLILVLAIIIGATGPKEYTSSVNDVYSCANGSHVWDPNNCSGIQLSDNTTWWTGSAPYINALSRFWQLQFVIYTPQVGEVERMLDVEVVIWGRNDAQSSDTWNMLDIRNTTQNVVCAMGPGPCMPLVLVDDRNIKYNYYAADVRFMNGGVMSGDMEAFIGDVVFTFWTGENGYTSLELALRVIYVFVACILLAAFLWYIRIIPYQEWAWEQRALVILQITVIFLNNPFYGFQYATGGWFFHFVDAVFTVLYLSVFFLFALLVLDKLRLQEVNMKLADRRHALKYLLVGSFALLAVILFAWVDIRDDYDPILSNTRLVSGMSVLFYIVATIYAGILIWVVVLVVMTIPVAMNQSYLGTRLGFIAVPTCFTAVSILIGIFAGTLGPVNNSTLSMVFFLTLYNLYVWVLTVGFWPIRERYAARNPSEADPIIRFDSKL